jgi:uncharacterized protein (TIGR00255 family)
MTFSMTGFSSISSILPRYKLEEQSRMYLTMTLKSLNSRFFEINCKLPYTLTQLETDLIKLFKSKLYRGNIYFTIHMANSNALLASVEPSFTTIASYLKAIEYIQAHFPIQGTLSVSDLIHLPNIFSHQEEPLNQDTVNLIMSGVHELIDTLNQTRKKEGSLLAQDLYQRIALMEDYLQIIEPRSRLVMEQRKNQLFQVLDSMLAEGTHEAATEAQNMVIYNQLDKIDIHEEIIRFKTHLGNLRTILGAPEPEKGKKMDFTLQELFREINTMAAKCSDATISSIAINTKVELEKAREQAQNIV